MVQINWTLQARDDLESIAEFISKNSAKYARLQVVRIRMRTKILISQPFSGKVVTEINRRNVRELIEGNYRIVYWVVDETRIDILTVHHAARDLGKRNI